MAIFKSSNPVLSEKKLRSTVIEHTHSGDVMSIGGTMQKFGFMLFMLLASSFYSWKEFAEGGNVMPLILTGIFGGLVVALVIVFKRDWAPFLAPLYALLQGLFIGAVSAAYNSAFAEIAPNIVMNAVGLTLGVSVAMYMLYHFRLIKVTQKFRSVLFIATAG